MRLWTYCSGGALPDFAAAGSCADSHRKSDVSWNILLNRACLYRGRHEQHLSNRAAAPDGGGSYPWHRVISELSGHIPSQQLAGVGHNSPYGFHRYFRIWLSGHLGNYLFHYQEKYEKDQRHTEAKTAKGRNITKKKRHESINVIKLVTLSM